MEIRLLLRCVYRLRLLYVDGYPNLLLKESLLKGLNLCFNFFFLWLNSLFRLSPGRVVEILNFFFFFSVKLSSTESLLENENYVLQINHSSIMGHGYIYSTVK